MENLNFAPWDQGWAPKNALRVKHHIPYTPFSKTDRIGKIADWVAPTVDVEEKTKDEYKGRKKLGAQMEAFGTSFTSAFSYQISPTEEADFLTVDRAPQPKTKSKVASWGAKREYTQTQPKKPMRAGQPDKNIRVRGSSIKVEAEWEQVEELDFIRLSSLYFEVDDPVDM